ncbi:MAG: glycosyltransferase family 39 protein [Thermodesulfovibrionales bacterium]
MKTLEGQTFNHMVDRLAEKQWQHGERVLLIAILVLAGWLRLYHLSQSPPGMNVDEAAIAWNSHCLLKTGMDQHGIRWPIFDSEGFGQGLTTLSLYLLIPFQAVAGFTATAARLPSAFGGILTVFLLYMVGSRLFDRRTGLLAAALLALNPWHLQQSRWGHMGALFPLLAIAPLALMLWARLPFDDNSQQPRVGRAAVAGLVTGLCSYGYYAARLWLPIFYASAILVNLSTWWKLVKTRQGMLAVGALLLTLALTFGPLVWASASFPLLRERAGAEWVWSQSDTLDVKIEKVLSRYPGHFGPDFLFQQGDQDIAISPPKGYGLFHWYVLPMLIAGLVYLIPQVKTSRSSRVLLTWVVLYPAADLLSEHPSMHAIRSLPGVCALTLLAAVGALFIAKWLWRLHKPIAIIALTVAVIIIFAANIRFLNAFYGEFNNEPTKYFVGHVDLLKACEWLKPRLKGKDAVFVTGVGMSHPYIYTLVGLQYDAQQWFLDQKEMVKGPLPGGAYNREYICLRYGKMHFVFDNVAEFTNLVLSELSKDGKAHRIVFIVRPGEFPLANVISPSYQIMDPLGYPSLLLYETNF